MKCVQKKIEFLVRKNKIIYLWDLNISPLQSILLGIAHTFPFTPNIFGSIFGRLV